MLLRDEVRRPKDVPTGGKKPSKKQLEGAVAIIEELSAEWKPEPYEDCYRERLRRVIDAKRKRRTIEVPPGEGARSGARQDPRAEESGGARNGGRRRAKSKR